jgi:type III secretion protein R
MNHHPVAELQTSFASSELPMLGLLAVMALVPFAVVMLTSFSKMAVVLSLVRSALGTQQAPPTIVLTGLAAVLTAHVMAPVFEDIYRGARHSYDEQLSGEQLVDSVGPTLQPLKDFLTKHGSAEDRARFLDMARELRPAEQASLVSESDLTVVIPAFVVTELKEAFTIGFLIFLPFLVLDMLIANVLLALGMQMLNPTQVSLPFKLLLFVAIDGWGLLAQALVAGYR